MEDRLKRIRLQKINPALKAKIFSQVKARAEEESLPDSAGFARGFWAAAAMVFIFLCAVNIDMCNSHENFMIKEYHACGDNECRMEMIALAGVNLWMSSRNIIENVKSTSKAGG